MNIINNLLSNLNLNNLFYLIKISKITKYCHINHSLCLIFFNFFMGFTYFIVLYIIFGLI